MIRIPVKTEKPYEVLVAEGLLQEAPARIASLSSQPGKLFFVSDQTVYSLYGGRLEEALKAGGFAPSGFFAFPSGEASKSLVVYQQLLEAMVRAQLSRKDLVIALGGGVTGDLTGFAAATYLRGLPWVQIPTTLLAMVDSSVGGKTGLNLPEGKNLLGAFHQPSLVLCDPALLASLPPEELKNGMGELIKTAFLHEPLWELLEAWEGALPSGELIARAIEVKAALVAADEADFGTRRLLNLGHSIGHAIEGVSSYQIPHGQAVAMGMRSITRAAVRQGLCESSALTRLEALLTRHHLNSENPFGAEELLPFMKHDKKAGGSWLTLVIPRRIGQCELRKLSWEELPDWIG
ncbi:MAG: 3-dehydroquinate synthase [Lachnospiraceae bacterium]|nr:3-dehydroquinate synthase [Lachnospiraceae bacterium]